MQKIGKCERVKYKTKRPSSFSIFYSGTTAQHLSYTQVSESRLLVTIFRRLSTTFLSPLFLLPEHYIVYMGRENRPPPSGQHYQTNIFWVCNTNYYYYYYCTHYILYTYWFRNIFFHLITFLFL